MSIVLVLTAAACTGRPESAVAPSPSARPSVDEDKEDTTNAELGRIACENVPREALLRTWRGIQGNRSGDIQIIPAQPDFVSSGLSHSTPYDVTQHVPLFLYGPGYVKPGLYRGPVTLADIAPTTAAMLKFPFDAPDGSAQRAALLPEATRGLPRLVVTVIWDSGGYDVLRRWSDRWPYLHSLVPEGAWFTNASTGSSPSNTPTAHPTIGTGAFPMHHGFVDEYVRLNGVMEKPNANGPAFLLEPTLADLYDPAMGNEPKVGAIATLAAHIMMMSHGSQWGGGDADLAITREREIAETAGAETVRWNLTSHMGPYYELPAYANKLPPLSSYLDDLDRADGALDGRWRDNDIAALAGGFDTPARTTYQETLVEKVIDREGFGADDVPDLLYVNYKAIDTIGHRFSADGIEMGDAVAVQDAVLKELVTHLNDRVGRGRWVMVLSADHGTQRDPAVSGAFLIDVNKLEAGLEATFDADDDGVDVLQDLRPTQVWLNRAELADNGFTLRQVSRWFLGLTQQDTFKDMYSRRSTPQPGHEDDPVFAAALPSRILSQLPCLPDASGSGAS